MDDPDWIRELAEDGACEEAVAWARTQPDQEAAWRACDRADWAGWLLNLRGWPEGARAAYQAARAPALAAYDAATAPAWAAYQAAEAPARAAYEAARAPAWAAYNAAALGAIRALVPAFPRRGGARP